MPNKSIGVTFSAFILTSVSLSLHFSLPDQLYIFLYLIIITFFFVCLTLRVSFNSYITVIFYLNVKILIFNAIFFKNTVLFLLYTNNNSKPSNT